jgi:hypothetical protein
VDNELTVLSVVRMASSFSAVEFHGEKEITERVAPQWDDVVLT